MADETGLSLETTEDAGVARIRCGGRLVTSTAGRLSAQVKPLIRSSSKIVLDLSNVTFMDSMGLGAVASLYVSCKTAGCTFEVVNLTKRVRDLFTVTHLLSLFEPCGETDARIV